jgi:hypothetical protein
MVNFCKVMGRQHFVMAALGGCLSEPDLMGGIVAWQKHNLATLLQLTVFGLLVSVLKEFLSHNQPHYSKF